MVLFDITVAQVVKNDWNSFTHTCQLSGQFISLKNTKNILNPQNLSDMPTLQPCTHKHIGAGKWISLSKH